MKSVLALTIGVASLNYGAHVVVQNFPGYTTKLIKSLLVTGPEGCKLFVLDKGPKGVAAETQGGYKGRQLYLQEFLLDKKVLLNSLRLEGMTFTLFMKKRYIRYPKLKLKN